MAQTVGPFEALFSGNEQPEHGSVRREHTGVANPPDLGSRPGDSYQELERKYRHRTYQAQELMIEKLLRGQHCDAAWLERKLHMFDLYLDRKNFLIVLVRPSGNIGQFTDYLSDVRDGGQVTLIVSSIFSELLGERFSCYPSNLDDQYGFLLNFDLETIENPLAVVADLCRYAVKFIKDNFDLNLSVSVSDVCEGLFPLHDLFRDLEIAARDAPAPPDGVFLMDKPPQQEEDRRVDAAVEKQYLNAVVTQDFGSACQLTLSKVEELYAADRGNLGRAKAFVGRRMHTTSSILTVPLGSITMEDGKSVGEESMQLEFCRSYDELREKLKRIYQSLDTYFNLAPSEYTGTTGKVISFIHKNYSEPDLSVEMICDSLGKSRSYLSRLFKENTGMNLLDYLHTTRIAEAKKFLYETDLGISEIAAKVGYYSGWTLARVFKRYEGITPTAYRKAFCAGQGSVSAQPPDSTK